MLNWKAFPFLRLLMPLILGILLGDGLRLHLAAWWILVPFLLLPFLIRFVWYPMAYQHRVLYGILANVFFIGLGFMLITLHPETYHRNHFSQLFEQGDILIGIVSQVPTKKKRLSTVLKIHQLSRKHKKITVSGRLYASFPDTLNSPMDKSLDSLSVLRNSKEPAIHMRLILDIINIIKTHIIKLLYSQIRIKQLKRIKETPYFMLLLAYAKDAKVSCKESWAIHEIMVLHPPWY